MSSNDCAETAVDATNPDGVTRHSGAWVEVGDLRHGRRESLLAGLWRYLTFGWLLVTPEGDLFARRAGILANCERLRRWMPHYVRVHAVLFVLGLCGAMVASGGPRWISMIMLAGVSAEFAIVIVNTSVWMAISLESPG